MERTRFLLLASIVAVLVAPALASASGSNLTYHGGAIQRVPKAYLVFWGWHRDVDPQATLADPAGEAQYLIDFFRGVGGSAWLNTTTQYYQVVGGETQFVTNPPDQLAGVWYDDSTTPTVSTWTGPENPTAVEALLADAHFHPDGAHDPDASYVIALPAYAHDPLFHGQRVPHPACTGIPECAHDATWPYCQDPIFDPVVKPTVGGCYCAWHGSLPLDVEAKTRIAYTHLPYIPGSSCYGGTLDSVSRAAGHEYAETITDPGPTTGWNDDSVPAGEIGDKCYLQAQSVTFPTGAFLVQSLWSNAAGACVFSTP